jgi:HK97 family phage prohead protease
MLKKDFGLSVKDVSGEGVFEGYASAFGGPPDSYGDVIAPGAFGETLAKHRREGTMPMMFFGHDMSELPIGDWLEMAEDGKGLWAKGRLDLEDPVSLRVHRALKQKRVRGLSIGYTVPTGGAKPDEKKPGVTILEKIDLIEVSIVNRPANRRSQVDSVKSMLDGGRMPTLSEFEDFLREAGFSRTQAKAIAAHGLKHLLSQREAGREVDDQTAFLTALLG